MFRLFSLTVRLTMPNFARCLGNVIRALIFIALLVTIAAGCVLAKTSGELQAEPWGDAVASSLFGRWAIGVEPRPFGNLDGALLSASESGARLCLRPPLPSSFGNFQWRIPIWPP